MIPAVAPEDEDSAPPSGWGIDLDDGFDSSDDIFSEETDTELLTVSFPIVTEEIPLHVFPSP